MIKKIMKTILIVFILIEFINSTITLIENERGEINGYYYELWYADNIGKVRMSINENNFNCSWKNIDNALFQYGRSFNPQTTFDELGNIIINYEAQINAEGYTIAGVNGWGYSYEFFYIVEYYSDEFIPPGTSLGTIIVDDGEYEIFYDEKILPPNIHGFVKEFKFYSVRKEKRLKGTINFNKHFESWKKKGCKFEYLSLISFVVEGYKSNGNTMANQIEINYENN